MKLGKQKLTVIGKEWFDRVNGNSYVAVRVYKADKLLFTIPYTYGYGDYYLQVAKEELIKRYEDKQAIKDKYYRELFSVQELITGCLKRDVKEWGEV